MGNNACTTREKQSKINSGGEKNSLHDLMSTHGGEMEHFESDPMESFETFQEYLKHLNK